LPYMKNGRRDYKRENEKYNSRPDVVKKRVARNAARRQLMKEGVVHKGDGLQVDHKKPLSKGGKNNRGNLRAVPASKNTSFARNKDGSLKSQTSKRERSRGKR
jgi:5-methylcytosine-specific restriction endonuclease McrA